MSSAVTANCDCGKVTLTSTEQPILQLCCHCSDCREATGDDYTTIAFFNVDAVSVAGAVSSHRFTAATGNNTSREICVECKTPMFDKSEGFPTLIGVITKQIAAPFEANPTHHVWVASKLAHVAIPTKLESFSENMF